MPARDGPALPGVATAGRAPAMPRRIGTGRVEGFGRPVLRAVTSGRGHEASDLAAIGLRAR